MTAPAGWHPDPESPGVLRYWDGQAWTNRRAPQQQPVYAAPQDHSTVEMIGILSALAVPIVGLLIGLFLIGKSSMAGWVIGLSLASAVGWIYFLSL